MRETGKEGKSMALVDTHSQMETIMKVNLLKGCDLDRESINGSTVVIMTENGKQTK
jgi:hypothetical protein